MLYASRFALTCCCSLLLMSSFAQTIDSTDITILSSPKKGFIVLGEQFVTDISIHTRKLNLADYDVFMDVNKKSVEVTGNTAQYRAAATQLGPNDYKVEVSLYHRQTKEHLILRRTFSYEVGLRSISVTADKMNVFYIGVDNPLSVSVAGVSSKSVNVIIENGTRDSVGLGKYIVHVTRPGECKVTVQGESLSTTFYFRNKRIPDPIPKLGALYGSESMDSEKFKAQMGVACVLENFDFDAKCNTVGYELTRVSASGTRTTVSNAGARYSSESEALIAQAQKGDLYLFHLIKCICPGDTSARTLGSIVIEIK
jgi:GldM C-terminal domain